MIRPNRRLLAVLISSLIFFYRAPNFGQSRPTDIALPIEELKTFVLPLQNNEALLKEALQQREQGRPLRFATAIPVRISPDRDGRWDEVGDLAVWRFRLRSPGAHSLNLGFGQYWMPPGGSLYIYDRDRENRNGPFTPADNETHNELWTPVFPGEELVIEVRVPQSRKSKLAIELIAVNHDFLGFGQYNSGSCNLDIVCGAEDGWGAVEPFRDVARSVGIYSIRGTLLCTGFLVNNTRQDCTPYFLTANHCEVNPSNASSVVVYWNYENSTCRQPNSEESGQDGDGKLNNFNTGSIFRASWFNSDFCLIELDDPVSETANAFFSGWSAKNEKPLGELASIHHPFSDEKRISFSDTNPFIGFWPNNNEAADGNHIVISWSTGTTQGGSSGAPLFDSRGLAIGQLHGGTADCANSSEDFFGRMYNSWEGGNTRDSRLKDWLDPKNLGLLSLNGRDQKRCNLSILGEFMAGTVCAGMSDTLELFFGPGFESKPELEISSLDPGLGISVEETAGGNTETARIVLHTSDITPAGNQQFKVYTTYEGQIDTNYFQINVTKVTPEGPVLQTPANAASGLDLQVSLNWSAQEQAEEYRLQLAGDPEFGTLVLERIVAGELQTVVSDLVPSTTYYWRVASGNSCGFSDWSPVYSFTTENLLCGQTFAADEPIEISSSKVSTVSSELEIDLPGTVAFIKVKDVNIRHNWVGDLSILLRSPSGKEVALLDRPGFPANLFGCDGSNILLNFDEALGRSHQELENTCSSNLPAISGTFKPLQSLEGLIGEKAAGTWTLVVKDNAEEDGGAFNGWSLDICTVEEAIPLISGISGLYTSCVGDSLDLELAISDSFTGDEVTLALDPGAGEIAFSKNPASPGDTIVLSIRNYSTTGIFPMTLTASDGLSSGSSAFSLEVLPLPEAVVLQAPGDGSSIASPEITFIWSEVAGSTYLLEVASDPEFMTVVSSVETTSGFSTLALPEQAGEFFWRITAGNDCGLSVSQVSSFIYSTSSISELEDGQRANVFPNPFGTHVFLEFSQSLTVPVGLRIFDVTGRVLLDDVVQQGSHRKRIDLARFPPAMYLLEIEYKGKKYLHRLLKGH